MFYPADPIITPSLQPSGREEPEVKAVMNWTLSTPGGFVAGGSLHEVGSWLPSTNPACLVPGDLEPRQRRSPQLVWAVP